MVERIIHTRSRGLFQTMNIDAVVDISRRATEVRLKPGEVLWKRGDPGAFNALIEYGHLRCTNEAGESVIIGAEFALGALDALAGAPRRYDVVAETDVIFTRGEQEDFFSVMETYTDLAMGLVGLLSRAMMQANLRNAQKQKSAREAG